MIPENYFFLIFIATILMVRIALYVKPHPSPTIKGIRLHHWMYGLFLIPLAVMLKNIPLYAIGLGLFIDELTFLLIGGKTHEDNYSWKSLIGTVLFTIVVFFLRGYLVRMGF